MLPCSRSGDEDIDKSQEFIADLLLRAVHQVLLAEGHQLARGLEVRALHGAHGAEGPAGAAVQLVLDGRDVPLLPPVLVFRGVLGVTARVD